MSLPVGETVNALSRAWSSAQPRRINLAGRPLSHNGNGAALASPWLKMSRLRLPLGCCPEQVPRRPASGAPGVFAPRRLRGCALARADTQTVSLLPGEWAYGRTEIPGWMMRHGKPCRRPAADFIHQPWCRCGQQSGVHDSRARQSGPDNESRPGSKLSVPALRGAVHCRPSSGMATRAPPSPFPSLFTALVWFFGPFPQPQRASTKP